VSVTTDDGTPAGIEAAYDDPEAPSELTLFTADTDRVATRWLTVDIEHAVDLAEWA
jgi:hypothetical protein